MELGILRLSDSRFTQRAKRLLEAPLGAQRNTKHLMQNGRTARRPDGGARPRLHFGKAAHGMERHQFLDRIGGAGRSHRSKSAASLLGDERPRIFRFAAGELR